MKASTITRIGIIVTFAIVLLVWGLNYLRGIDLFKSSKSFYVNYEKVEGLIVSSPVYMRGMKIGQVTSMDFAPDNSGNIIVAFSTGDEFQLKKAASAEIYSTDLMGTKAVKLKHGDSNDFHAAGDTIIGKIEGDLKDQVNMTVMPIKVKAEKLLSSFDSVLTVVTYLFNKKAQENLTKSLINLTTTINNIEHTSFEIDSLITFERSNIHQILSNIESFTSTLKGNSEHIGAIIENTRSFSDTLNNMNIKATVDNLNLLVQELGDLAAKINNSEGTVGQLVNNDTLYQHIETATYNLNRLIRDFYENPKRYIHFSAVDMGKTIYIEDGNEKNRMRKKPRKKDYKKEQKILNDQEKQ